MLRAELFNKVPSVIMTSATLAVGRQGSFDFFRRRIGLTKATTKRWGSPFDYRRQAELILIDGMPDPADAHRYQAEGGRADQAVRRPDRWALPSFCSPATR